MRTRLLFAGMLLFCFGFDQGGCDCTGGGGGTTSGSNGGSTAGSSSGGSTAGSSGGGSTAGSTGSTSQCTADAQCPADKICTNNVCLTGCAADHCASGACKTATTCAECTVDSQCGTGRACCNSTCVDTTTASDCGTCGNQCASGICGTGGVCVECATDAQCASGNACCNNTCLNAHTTGNCGGCGITCSGDQFCSGSGCFAPTFADLCSNPTATLILDGLADDDGAGNAIADALASSCGFTVARVAQATATQIDPQTGVIHLGTGNTVVVSGGPFWQHMVSNLETTTHVMPVYFAQTADAAVELRLRATDALIVHATAITATHDYFVLELATDPASGALAFVSYGFDVGGTHAAAYYFATAIMPHASTQHLREVIVEWTDTSGDSHAGAGDTYHVLSAQ